MESSHSADIPTRQYMDDPSIEWKDGKPDYTLVNNKYLAERSKKHKPDSMEKFVENLVKTWEMESSHKGNAKDWNTVDREKFHIQANGGFVGNLKDNINFGNYNLLMKGAPLYDASLTWDESHDLFRGCFPGGFPWELLELYSGPPNVSFTWRHWAHWTGPFMGVEPTGELIEMFGSCVAKTSAEGKIVKLDIYFDPNVVLATLMKFDLKNVQGCPYANKK